MNKIEEILNGIASQASQVSGVEEAVEELTNLIEKKEREAYERASRDLEKEFKVKVAKEAHRTEEGYCCACDYDICGFNKEIKENQDNIMFQVRRWAEEAWRNGWINKKHWEDDQELYASIRSFIKNTNEKA